MPKLDDIHLTTYLPPTEIEGLLEARSRINRAEGAIEKYIEDCVAAGGSQDDILTKLRKESEEVGKPIEEQGAQSRIGATAVIAGCAVVQTVYTIGTDVYDRYTGKKGGKKDD